MTEASAVERLREAVLSKAREEAERIVREAEERARRIVAEAEERKRREVEEARKRLYEEVGYEARIAEARIRASHIVSEVKNTVLEELRKRVMEKLSSLSDEERRRSLRNLLSEALSRGIVQGRIGIVVSKRDCQLVHDVIASMGLRDRIAFIECSERISGGIVVESEDRSVRIDNTYETRLDMFLRTNSSRISSELFGD